MVIQQVCKAYLETRGVSKLKQDMANLKTTRANHPSILSEHKKAIDVSIKFLFIKRY